jgi:HSP20 family molecular chaperone IbpA
MKNELTRTCDPLPAASEAATERPIYVPMVDILETPEEYLVTADLPGCTSDGITVAFENGMLTIHGTPSPRPASARLMILEEAEPGEYHRSFNVTESIEASRISAECSDGVLRLHLPKVEASKPRRIEVKPA